jgi:hypothetical protein
MLPGGHALSMGPQDFDGTHDTKCSYRRGAARCGMISLCMGDALHRVRADVVLGGDHAHAWAMLPAQIGEDRALNVGGDLGSAELLALVPGPP